MIRQLEAEGRAKASAYQTPYHWAAAYVLLALALVALCPVRHAAEPSRKSRPAARIADLASVESATIPSCGDRPVRSLSDIDAAPPALYPSHVVLFCLKWRNATSQSSGTKLLTGCIHEIQPR